VGGANLVSITYAQLLAGQLNAMVIDDEIINFQNVTDNGDGSYTLDTFLRGRRGTDTNADDHAGGENFYLMNSTIADGFTIPLSDVGTVHYFKGVSDGQTIEEATTVILTPTGEDLKPYAPINVVRSDQNSPVDIVLTWDRRTRIDGGISSVPLNEDTEEYEVDILAGAGGAVVRTIAGITSETATYTNAQQVTDSFGGGTLYARVYQISAQVDRGKSYEWELL